MTTPYNNIFEVDYESKWVKHLLAAAAYRNDKATVQRLLAEGCDATEGSGVFGISTRAAALQGNNEVLEILLSWTSRSERFLRARCAALRGATQGGHLDTLNLVLDPRWGVISPSESLYTEALKYGLRTKSPDVFDRVALLVRPHRKGYPEICLPALLAQATGSGSLQMVSHLLKEGAFVNGDTKNPPANPLRSASLKGHTGIVKLLLEHGARPRFGWGDTLVIAARSGYLDIVRILLSHGADVNERPAEELRAPPAIVSAIQLEHEEMFHFLRKRGAILKTPETGARALKIAVEQGLESMLELLLREGVEVDDSHIDTATKHGHDEIVRILRQHKEMPRKNSSPAWVWQKVYGAITESMQFRLLINARKEKIHAPQKQPHSAPHTSSSPPSVSA